MSNKKDNTPVGKVLQEFVAARSADKAESKRLRIPSPFEDIQTCLDNALAGGRQPAIVLHFTVRNSLLWHITPEFWLNWRAGKLLALHNVRWLGFPRTIPQTVGANWINPGPSYHTITMRGDVTPQTAGTFGSIDELWRRVRQVSGKVFYASPYLDIHPASQGYCKVQTFCLADNPSDGDIHQWHSPKGGFHTNWKHA